MICLLLGVSDKFYSIENNKIEFLILVIFIYIGAVLLINSIDFISILILLECIAFSSYILVGFERKNKFSSSSGIKYLILGSIPGGLFVLGITLLYKNYGSFFLCNLENLLITIDNSNFKEERDYFDCYIKVYDKLFHDDVVHSFDVSELKTELISKLIDRADNISDFHSKKNVLEIGCGIGRVGKQLAPLCKEWIGCDISGNMLKYTKFRLSNLKNIKLVELPKSNLSPIPDGSIDVIYSTVVFMHLEEWDRYKYVSEAYRVLKKGGRAYFDNFSLNTKEGWEIFMAHYNLNDRPSHISKSSTSEELAEYLKKSKFKNIVTKLDDPWVIASGIK